jgi:hypothetical protein
VFIQFLSGIVRTIFHSSTPELRFLLFNSTRKGEAWWIRGWMP